MKRIIILLLFSSVFAEVLPSSIDDGYPINIWGHVQKPGLIHVDFKNTEYDLIYLLSKAGGPLPNAKLNKVKIISKDKKEIIVNLEKIMQSGDYSKLPNINRNDTIIIEPKLIYNLKNNSSLIHTLLYLTTIGLQISTK